MGWETAEIIKKTLSTMQKLPKEKVEEVSDFADYLLQKSEIFFLAQAAAKIGENGGSFDFLEEDAVFYSVADLKKSYEKR